jgi:hypothetical protein
MSCSAGVLPFAGSTPHGTEVDLQLLKELDAEVCSRPSREMGWVVHATTACPPSADHHLTIGAWGSWLSGRMLGQFRPGDGGGHVACVVAKI